MHHLLQLTAGSSVEGIDGLEALLGAAGPAYLPVSEATAWAQAGVDWERMSEIPTGLLWWPGQENEDILTLAQARGIECQSVAEFLHKLWKDELVFSLPEPYVLLNGRPLLWHLLQAGGFEPSLLWPGLDKTWIGERGPGLCWVVPEAWLNAAGAASLGRRAAAVEGYWEAGVEELAFYRSKFQFLGFLERWPQPLLEHKACAEIVQALEYGVSWADIKRALRSWGLEVRRARWDMDDTGPGTGTGGEELPASPAYDLENRRTG